MLKQLSLLALATMLATSALAEAPQDQARANAMLLGKTLKGELQAAMQADGPIAAINVCNVKAMPIADEISAKTGWIVARTSLKVRNSANQPDAWEKQQLESFDQQLAAGNAPAKLEVFQEFEENGKIVQRFMKAIPTEEGCLACHGEKLAQPVLSKLDELYPNDQARGYQAGQLRGAFTLQRTITK